jgi:hypothetical protein
MRGFKVIEEFPKYSVSRSGMIINNKTGRILKFIYRKKYFAVDLGRYNRRSIARLVGLAFIPNPENKPEINHKDGNTHNNWDWNLEWSTRSENQSHAYKLGLQTKPENSGTPKKPVKVFNYKTGEFKSTESSMREASIKYDVLYNSIRLVLKGTYKHTHGLTFKLI